MLPPEIAEGLKLLGEELEEAVTDRNTQRSAVEKAAKAAATVCVYIKADEMRTTIVMLVCEQLTGRRAHSADRDHSFRRIATTCSDRGRRLRQTSARRAAPHVVRLWRRRVEQRVTR